MGDHSVPQFVNPSQEAQVLKGAGMPLPDAVIEANKTFTAGGADNSLDNGGRMTEPQQMSFWTYIRGGARMLAPAYRDYSQYPDGSPLANAYNNQTPFLNGSASLGQNPVFSAGDVQIVTHRNGALSGLSPQLHARGAITRGATENTQRADAYRTRNIAWSERQWQLIKLQWSYAWSTEVMSQNISGQRLNETLGKIMGFQMVQDFEDLAINGDPTRPAELDINGRETARSELLRLNEGWLSILNREANGHSEGGEFISEDVFHRVLKSLPPSVAGNTDWKWWMNPQLWFDFLEVLRSLGSDAPLISQGAHVGQGIQMGGFPAVAIPMFPTDQALSVFTAATPARMLAGGVGPFRFRTNAFRIGLNVDAAGAVDIVFPHEADPNPENRLLHAYRVAQIINTQYATAHGATYRNVARATDSDRIEFVSPTTGAASSIAITVPGAGSSALEVIGLRVETVAGEAVGTGNTLFQGTPLILCPSWNFQWHVSTADQGSNNLGVRLYSKYDQGTDSFQTDCYTYQDATIENPLFAYYVRDLRVAPPGVSAVPAP